MGRVEPARIGRGGHAIRAARCKNNQPEIFEAGLNASLFNFFLLAVFFNFELRRPILFYVPLDLFFVHSFHPQVTYAHTHKHQTPHVHPPAIDQSTNAPVGRPTDSSPHIQSINHTTITAAPPCPPPPACSPPRPPPPWPSTAAAAWGAGGACPGLLLLTFAVVPPGWGRSPRARSSGRAPVLCRVVVY